MSLQQRLQDDWKAAMKVRDSFKASVINMARAAILHQEKTDGNKLDDDAVITILAREVKQRRDAAVEYSNGNRQDLVDQANKESEILLEYLPQQLSETEVRTIILEAVNEIGAVSIKDMGKLMTAVMPKLKGRADGKLVNQIVKDILK
jgi:uncharacterized protein YqeY